MAPNASHFSGVTHLIVDKYAGLPVGSTIAVGATKYNVI